MTTRPPNFEVWPTDVMLLSGTKAATSNLCSRCKKPIEGSDRLTPPVMLWARDRSYHFQYHWDCINQPKPLDLKLTAQLQKLGYVQPLGTPYNWRHEVTGTLSDAFFALVNHRAGVQQHPPNQQQLHLVWVYLVYYLAAPCWTGFAGDHQNCPLQQLRALATVPLCPHHGLQQIDKLLHQCLQAGIDPL